MSVRINQRWPEDVKATLDRLSEERDTSVTDLTLHALRVEYAVALGAKATAEDLAGSYDSVATASGETVRVTTAPPKPPSRPKTCPDHPEAGRLKANGRTYCDAPLCQFVYS